MNYTRRINKLSSRQFWFERNGSDSVASAISGDTLPEIKKTPGTSITISNYSRNLPRNIYIYICIHIIQASPLIYLDKVESRDEGCFSRARHRHAEECQTAFAHPFDAISELLSPPLLEILDFPRYALWSSTNRDSSRWFTKPRFLYRSWKKKKRSIVKLVSFDIRNSLISLKLGKNRFLPISR